MSEAMNEVVSEKTETPEPGIYPDTEGSEYAKYSAVSFRRLMDLSERGPYAMRHFQKHPDDRPEAGAAANFGIAVHCAMLEPERYAAEYGVLPDVDGRTKGGRDARKDIALRGLIPISWSDSVKISRMIVSAREHPQVGKVLEEGPERLTEHTAISPHEDTDLAMKVRADIILPAKHMILDLKTTGNVLSADNLERMIWPWAQQLAMMEQTFRRAAALTHSPLSIKHFRVLAIETAPPFECALFFPDAGTLDLAHHRVNTLMALYAQCEKRDHWPRLGEEGVVGVSAKPWLFAKYGEDA